MLIKMNKILASAFASLRIRFSGEGFRQGHSAELNRSPQDDKISSFCRRKDVNNKAQSTMEYISFLIVVLITLIYFQKYIVRGISGRLRTVGESFANHRLYDPNKTKFECAFDVFVNTETWYDAKCFFEGIGGIPGCGVPACLASTKKVDDCKACIQSCKPLGNECDVPQ